MRACRSYLSLMARSTLYKELALFVLMAVVELALFIPNLEKQFSEVVGIGGNGEEIYSMYSLPVDEIAENTHLQWVWIAALVLLSLILIRTAGRWRDYTLDRLGVSRRQGNLLYGLYGTLSFLLLWAFQAALVLVMCLLYRQNLPAEKVTEQTVLLSIYRTPFFFSMLPLAGWARWVTNACMMAALGLCAASGARLRRLGRIPEASNCLLILLFWFGYGNSGVSNLDGDAGFFAVAFCFAAAAVARMTVWDSEDNGEGEPYERLDNQV